jgi:hypothetical protein
MGCPVMAGALTAFSFRTDIYVVLSPNIRNYYVVLYLLHLPEHLYNPEP